MKLTVILLFTGLMQVSAAGYAQKVTLQEKDASLQTVFKEITRQTGYVFFYSDDLLNKATPVSVNVKDMPLEEALQLCFRNQPLDYFIRNKTIAVRESVYHSESVAELYGDVVIRGKVVDSLTGELITGATVSLAGSPVGTATDSYGDFSLLLLDGEGKKQQVNVSFIGYKTYTFTTTGKDMGVLIKLSQEAVSLKETVVTGIFNRDINSYTGSTVTLTREDIKRVGNANVFQALKNISPSMVLDNFSMGSDPNNLPNIQLRGTSTFPQETPDLGADLKGNYLRNPNAPLFILNGFEATAERIYDLDINRIKTVTILKDAASKAIYGAKAANGVIVIETDNVTSAGARVSYYASVDLDLPDLTSYNLTNATEKLEAERIDGMYTPTSANPQDYVELQQLYNARKKAVMEGLNTDWIAKPLRDGIGQKHTISVELGGHNGLNMVADVSYRDVQGVMKGSYRKNITGNISTSYRVHNFLFRNIMSANKNKSGESPYGNFEDYAKMNPYWRAENADGSIPFYAEEFSNGAEVTNPLYNAGTNTEITADYFNFTDNFYLEWTVFSGLRAMARLGIDVKNSNADEFYPASNTRFDGYTGDLLLRKGSYQVNNGSSNYLSGDFNLTYSKTIGRSFYFANGGFNISERKYKELAHIVEGFSSDRMDDIIFGRAYALDSRPVGIDGINRDIGFLGSFSYMYDNRFLSDLTLRSNASSQFGSEKRWAQFWSIGLGWNLHHENFMAGLPQVELFKIRGSVGSTGNPNFNTNASVATYAYYLDALYQGFPGSYLTNMANDALQWETKLDYNLGFDAKIRNLNLRFDYYESYTENLITAVTIPASTGFTSVSENLGRVKNTGFEVNASYLVWSKGRNFFSINGSLETNKNRIVELSDAMKSYNERMDELAADKSNSTPVKKYEDGLSMNAIWAVPSLGIDPATGNEIYVKQDGNTTYDWDASDLVVAGNSYPPYQGIIGLSGEYQGIGINITGRYLTGGQLYNQTLVDKVENVDMNYNVDRRVLTGRWNHPGQHAQFKRLGTYSADKDGSGVPEEYPEKTRATSRFVQDRQEFTIGAINVYYNFNEQLISRWGLQRLKLGFNMNEVATFSTIRIERGTTYPFARTLSFSLSTTFK